MLTNIFKQYKKNLLAVIFLIIGYTLAILTLSIGISVINDTNEYEIDKTSGNTDNLSIASIGDKDINKFSYVNTSLALNEISNNLEVQLLNFGTMDINGDISKKTQVVPLVNTKMKLIIILIEMSFQCFFPLDFL